MLWDLGLKVPSSGFGIGLRDSCFVSRVSFLPPFFLVFRVPGFGCRVPSFGFRVSGFDFRASDSEFRVSGFGNLSADEQTARLQTEIVPAPQSQKLSTAIVIKTATAKVIKIATAEVIETATASVINRKNH